MQGTLFSVFTVLLELPDWGEAELGLQAERRMHELMFRA
jgi:hypothetical protein